MNEIPKNMRGVYLHGHGGLDKLEVRDDIPVPTHDPNEVLIRVGATAVNNTDINTRLAWYSKSDGDSSDASWPGSAIHFPRIHGADVCGRVVAVGEKVENNLLNERVIVEPCILEADGKALEQPWYFGSECDGGFAEYPDCVEYFWKKDGLTAYISCPDKDKRTRAIKIDRGKKE